MLAGIAGLDSDMVDAWAANGELDEDTADRMIENVIGTYSPVSYTHLTLPTKRIV